MELLHAKMIVDLELPMNLVEKESFHELMEANNKYYKPVSTSVAANAANSLLQDFQECWRASDLPMFQDTVQRGARDRQIGVHPALLISTFLDPHCKSLFSVPDVASKAAINSRVLQLMKSSETTHHASLAPAAAPSEEKEESEDEDDMFGAMEAAAAAASYGGNNTSPGVLSVDNACSDELNCYMAARMLSIHAKLDGGYVWHDPLA
jgi:hypothetical protein